MACDEYIRQHYKASLLHWGHVLLPRKRTHRRNSALAAEIKQKVFEERDAAYDRLCLHKRTCLVCNPKLKVTQSARDKRAEAQKAPWASGKAGK
jgi:hypothetical protein